MPPGDDSTALGWWQQFAASVVSWLESRYGKSSLAGLEVWNEEESYPFSWSVQPDNWYDMAVRYSHMLCSAYAGVRQVDPNLPVIFGGIRPSDITYLSEAYQSPGTDIRGCMTAIGIHPYNDVNNTWVEPSTTNSPFASGASAVAQTSANNDDSGRPIWITEFGYPSAPSPMTQQYQADWDQEAYNLAPTLPNVQTMAIHTIFDSPGGFQICGGPNSPLPAANELKQAVSGNPNAVASC
jgi:hypothetical protein